MRRKWVTSTSMPPKAAKKAPAGPGGPTIQNYCDAVRGEKIQVSQGFWHVHAHLHGSSTTLSTLLVACQNELTGKPLRKVEGAIKIWSHALLGEGQVRSRGQ